MVRTPCCDKNGLKRGAWTPEEDRKLMAYVTRYGCWNWRQLPKFAGLSRCGKSCRLRWLNYLRPNIKRGNYTKEEEETIIRLHESLGNRWSAIAAQLPGRTDNEIKNHWHTNLKKKVKQKSSSSSSPSPSPSSSSSSVLTNNDQASSSSSSSDDNINNNNNNIIINIDQDNPPREERQQQLEEAGGEGDVDYPVHNSPNPATTTTTSTTTSSTLPIIEIPTTLPSPQACTSDFSTTDAAAALAAAVACNRTDNNNTTVSSDDDFSFMEVYNQDQEPISSGDHLAAAVAWTDNNNTVSVSDDDFGFLEVYQDQEPAISGDFWTEPFLSDDNYYMPSCELFSPLQVDPNDDIDHLQFLDYEEILGPYELINLEDYL